MERGLMERIDRSGDLVAPPFRELSHGYKTERYARNDNT